MKKDLKDQFLPTNTMRMAKESLKKFKQTGLARDYVKEFSSPILDIKDMSEVDKLFNLMSGLQGWAEIELRRQGVQDLPSDIVATDYLVDYKMTFSPTPTQKGKGKSKSRARSWSRRPPRIMEARVGKSLMHRPKWGREKSGCFIYEGLHRVRDFPRKEKLNAIIAEDGENSRTEALTRANPLQLLNAIQAKVTHKGLMYVEMLTGGQTIVALVDNGATHNFIDSD